MPEDLATGRQTQSTLTSTRIDSPHAVREDVAPHDSDAISVRVDEQAAKKVHAIVGNDPQMLVEQVRCEANELAFHLQGQQRDVDHREAEYCSRGAD